MLFTARSRKSIRPTNSGSKDSKDSNIGKKNDKIQSVSLAELKLRQAIKIKFEKSRIKNFKYTTLKAQSDKCKSNSSQNSAEMPQYANLLNQRYFNLQEYHNKACNKPPPTKQYLIKFRKSEYKKTINSEENSTSNPRLHNDSDNKLELEELNFSSFAKNSSIFEASFKERKTVSGEKKQSEWQKLGFNYHSTSKNTGGSHKRAPSQQEEPKSRLYYFRKKNKSPHQKYP